MTNWEKDKETFLKISASGTDFAVEKRTGKILTCNDLLCADCLFKDEYMCSATTRMKWLDEEYIEPKTPEIDWSKVPVDTPVVVWDDGDEDPRRRYFARYSYGKVFTFGSGTTSWSTGNKYYTVEWDHAEIAPGINCSKWYKE